MASKSLPDSLRVTAPDVTLSDPLSSNSLAAELTFSPFGRWDGELKIQRSSPFPDSGACTALTASLYGRAPEIHEQLPPVQETLYFYALTGPMFCMLY